MIALLAIAVATAITSVFVVGVFYRDTRDVPRLQIHILRALQFRRRSRESLYHCLSEESAAPRWWISIILDHMEEDGLIGQYESTQKNGSVEATFVITNDGRDWLSCFIPVHRSHWRDVSVNRWRSKRR